MRYTLSLLLSLLFTGTLLARAFPKREFRGAWIQTVFQAEYSRMTPAEMQADFIQKLDFLQARGINAILFQVRPEADAWYESRFEPWSRFLTGQQGLAPDPFFDPTRFLIRECHRRNMEFHAWINPFRAGTSGTAHLSPDHLYHAHPGWFVLYNNQLLFDPGVPACRQHLLAVIRDLVSRYDIDAVHLDDYFYPYPVAGIPFPDDASFRAHGIPAGFAPDQRAEWRRENVNKLVRDLKKTISRAKPWVRFGVSPFGIYRNKKDTPNGSGSDTRGTQNYSDLYADILLWEKNGWVDYIIPQLYWEIGHEAADYITLARWWNKNTRHAHLYIGQDVARAMKAGDLPGKMHLARDLPRVKGNCFWPANEILRDNGGIVDSLDARHHRYPALIPPFTRLSSHRPARPRQVKVQRDEGGYTLRWEARAERREDHLPRYFVIYGFAPGEKVDIEDPSKIKAITRRPGCYIPLKGRHLRYRFVVTAVDRYHNESRGRTIQLTL
ncbi:MAG: family 10 glycosylhydrolase [Odoribacteraceae bacterium]|jgi:uncharacterized lipoprotein YddW (UPF0748 family)|nr:family 10 glycosylhydrolase [Odoribacteraceae bacterium]